MAGKVKLSDARVNAQVRMDVRKGNAIDRDSHTVASAALFETESVPAGTEFSFRVDAENLTQKEAENLMKLMDVFAEGEITVGGRSRAGLGKVMLEQRTYKIWNRVEGAFPEEKTIGRAEDVLNNLTFQQETSEVTNVQEAG